MRIRGWFASTHLAALAVSVVSVVHAQGANEFSALANKELISLEIRSDTGWTIRIGHPTALWAFEQATQRPWSRSAPPEGFETAESIGYTLYFSFRDKSSSSVGITLVRKSGEPSVIGIGTHWCDPNSLLGQLLRVWLEERLPDDGTKLSDDSQIPHGFSPYEVRRLDFPELQKRIVQEWQADYEQRAMDAVATNDTSTIEKRILIMNGLVYKAEKAASNGRYDEALQCYDLAEEVPRPEDRVNGNGRPWKVQIQNTCLWARVNKVYIPSGRHEDAVNALRALLTMRSSASWSDDPSLDSPEKQGAAHQAFQQGQQKIEQLLKECESKLHTP